MKDRPMRTLGFSGGYEADHQGFPRPALNNLTAHDGAAVLVEDGEVVAAIEQERLNRIKHSNKAPLQAMRFCLESRGLTLQDIDHVCYYASEAWCDAEVKRAFPALGVGVLPVAPRTDAQAVPAHAGEMADVCVDHFLAVGHARERRHAVVAAGIGAVVGAEQGHLGLAGLPAVELGSRGVLSDVRPERADLDKLFQEVDAAA